VPDTSIGTHNRERAKETLITRMMLLKRIVDVLEHDTSGHNKLNSQQETGSEQDP